MQSLSRKNKGIKYLLCAIDLYSKYEFVIPLKDKKGISIVNAFNKIIKQSNTKPNKIRVDQGGEFYNNVFKKWLLDIDIITYSTYNEGKSVVAERFIGTLKNKLYKHMTATGKNVYYDVLDNVVNEYNNTKHSTIKMKPIDIKDNNKRVYVDEHNEKDSRFKVDDRVRISKFKNIFAKGYTPNWSKEIFIVDKINDTVPYTYNLKDLNDEEIIGSFYDRELQKTKLKAADIIAKSANTKANTIRSDLTGYAKKSDVATDITAIKHDYVTNASLTSHLNDLKSQLIATEVTGIDNKTKKKASDILALKNKLTQKEDTINENERGLSFNRGFFFYMDQSYLVYDCNMGSFGFGSKDILEWRSTGFTIIQADLI